MFQNINTEHFVESFIVNDLNIEKNIVEISKPFFFI